MREHDETTVVARSVWLTGQASSRDQRRGRYTGDSMAHPGKMLPAIARYLLHTYTDPGDLVLDPMAGIGTSVVEAMHAGRHGIGVEYEQRWADHAAANIAHATGQGAPGAGQVWAGDSRRLSDLLPAAYSGRVRLVITSPPYGASTHGHVRTPGPRRGPVRKIHHRYGQDTGNLAYQPHNGLVEGFTEILTGCAAVLHPDGVVAVTARPYRRHGELIDIPAMVITAGKAAGLELLDRCYPMLAGIRDDRIIPRGSFFQLRNIRAARAEGNPQWLVSGEDMVIFARPRVARTTTVPAAHSAPHQQGRDSISGTAVAGALLGRSLDVLDAADMDQFEPSADSGATHSPHGAADIRPHPGQDSERTTDPCPPYSSATRQTERSTTAHNAMPRRPDAPPQRDGRTGMVGRP
ncbi:hypothetical protein GCM10010124_40730 [Pilimelia terevasa]|uniref:Methyltransferase n=1 Tax=Pilimelia terevasa TaxID=53372 RepID=A0A8J3BQQ9_9ACTN|nr:DNA methyltransferase [Pilimelia terevasa]GGK43775.1 hypothetical protein GCM10010124_40730 [Pilimelia terevasa]